MSSFVGTESVHQSTTFPQTDAILENGIVNGVRAQDVQKILNLKHAWEFVLDKDVLRSDTDFYIRRPERHNTVCERKMLETVLG